jgi:phenylpyruvate tautomerase PptA (4-oxalocrotonate tautomerase family)
MASYVIRIAQDSITDARKAAVEEAVRLEHAEITGAPRHVTRVEIVEVDSGCFYLHGRLLECDHIFVHGVTVEDPQRDTREDLAARITSDVAAAADYEPESVIVSISEIPSDRMRVSARTP